MKMSPQEKLLLAIGIAAGLRTRDDADAGTFNTLICAISQAYLDIGGDRKILEHYQIIPEHAPPEVSEDK